MKRIKLTFENCYGIRRLESELDFSNGNVITIYAPNGVMKTSFAKTFNDVVHKLDTSDRIYPHRETTRMITDETGKPIDPEEVFVIEPYIADFESDKVSTLLVNKELRQKYEAIYKEIDTQKLSLLKKIKKLSGLKSEVEIEEKLSQDISSKRDFLIALNRVKSEVDDYLENKRGWENIEYAKVFNDGSELIFRDAEVLGKLTEYIETYDKLLESSNFFKKGVFNHNNASDIAKRLKDNGWFKARHSVNIRTNGEERRIETEEDLESAIKEEKEGIINNSALKDAFDKLDKALAKNKATKDFRDYLEIHKEILSELNKYSAFKEKLWIAYLAENKDEYVNLLELYENSKKEIRDIIVEADKQHTKWQDVIDEFNDRYSVPFRLKIGNQSDVVLAGKVPVIKFDFKEGEDEKDVEKDLLLSVLSQGEKRALYILNILFEVESRVQVQQPTLFIVDDIADSFDYKNKYAIIEYLKHISQIEYFKLIILTHNFDFHRNVSSRLGLPRKNRFCAEKYNDRIDLVEEKYQKNPFNEWKKFSSLKYEIAAIPFIRNLAELCGKEDIFLTLTSLLHQKEDTQTITMASLRDIYRKLIPINKANGDSPDTKVESQIYILADGISKEVVAKMELEDKVILSMAIRLKAERYMKAKINDDEFINTVKENQTYALSKKYKEKFPDDRYSIHLIDKVNLMTPENIHINSFMYEPILDMSNDHLKKLYNEISALKS